MFFIVMAICVAILSFLSSIGLYKDGYITESLCMIGEGLLYLIMAIFIRGLIK